MEGTESCNYMYYGSTLTPERKVLVSSLWIIGHKVFIFPTHIVPTEILFHIYYSYT